MSEPLLSIITINFNNKNGLQKTMDSVLNQSFQDYEYIIIDGGSSDGGKELIESYLEKSELKKHIAFWCSEKDGGIWDAMNKGILHAKGEYCLLLNSGDWFCDSYSLLKVHKAHPVEDIVYFDAMFVKKDSELLNSYPDEIGYYFFFNGSTLSHQNTIIRTSVQKSIPYTNNYRFAGDIEFFMNAFLKNNCTSRHVHDAIVCFDFEFGISSDPKTKDERAVEWERLRKQFFSPRIQLDLMQLQEYGDFKNRFKGIPYKLYCFLKKLRGR